MRLRWPIGLLVLLVAGAGAAQSLSELAEKEKERRKAAAAAGAQSFTNDDLEKGRPKASPTPPPAKAGGAARPPAKPGSAAPRRPSRDEGLAEEEEGDAAGPPPVAGQPGAESVWRQQGQSARDAISAAEQRVAAAEKALGAVRTGISQPLPSDGLRQTPPNALVREASQESAERNLATARASLEQAKAASIDLEERARKASIPPGWLR
jgi:hypothetical protein